MKDVDKERSGGFRYNLTGTSDISESIFILWVRKVLLLFYPSEDGEQNEIIFEVLLFITEV